MRVPWQAGLDAQQRRLATAVRADERQPLAGREGDVEVLEERTPAERAGEAARRQPPGRRRDAHGAT